MDESWEGNEEEAPRAEASPQRSTAHEGMPTVSRDATLILEEKLHVQQDMILDIMDGMKSMAAEIKAVAVFFQYSSVFRY